MLDPSFYNKGTGTMERGQNNSATASHCLKDHRLAHASSPASHNLSCHPMAQEQECECMNNLLQYENINNLLAFFSMTQGNSVSGNNPSFAQGTIGQCRWDNPSGMCSYINRRIDVRCV